MSALFDHLFSPMHPLRSLRRSAVAWHPFTDVFEEEGCFRIRVELAGVDVASLQVVKDGPCLVVRGSRTDPNRGRDLACHQLEISYGGFERVLCLPVDFREEDVKPEYDRSTGFLEITVEKERA